VRGKPSPVLGIVLALLQWGLQLIGISVNFWFGFVLLVLAFCLIAIPFWIWARKLGWHLYLRVTTLVVVGLLCSLAPLRQWQKGHGQELTESSPPIETTSVAGVVVDQVTNEAIGQARITIVGRTEESVTDDSGNFRIDLRRDVPKVLRLHVTKMGFQPGDINVDPPQENLVLQLHKQ
jgi:hypothetical protein